MQHKQQWQKPLLLLSKHSWVYRIELQQVMFEFLSKLMKHFFAALYLQNDATNKTLLMNASMVGQNISKNLIYYVEHQHKPICHWVKNSIKIDTKINWNLSRSYQCNVNYISHYNIYFLSPAFSLWMFITEWKIS